MAERSGEQTWGAGIAGEELARGIVDAGGAHLRIDAERVDRFLGGADVAEIQRGGDARGEDLRLDLRLLLLLRAVGGGAHVDNAHSGEQQQQGEHAAGERNVGPAVGEAAERAHQRPVLTLSAMASRRALRPSPALSAAAWSMWKRTRPPSTTKWIMPRSGPSRPSVTVSTGLPLKTRRMSTAP